MNSLTASGQNSAEDGASFSMGMPPQQISRNIEYWGGNPAIQLLNGAFVCVDRGDVIKERKNHVILCSNVPNTMSPSEFCGTGFLNMSTRYFHHVRVFHGETPGEYLLLIAFRSSVRARAVNEIIGSFTGRQIVGDKPTSEAALHYVRGVTSKPNVGGGQSFNDPHTASNMMQQLPMVSPRASVEMFASAGGGGMSNGMITDVFNEFYPPEVGGNEDWECSSVGAGHDIGGLGSKLPSEGDMLFDRFEMELTGLDQPQPLYTTTDADTLHGLRASVVPPPGINLPITGGSSSSSSKGPALSHGGGSGLELAGLDLLTSTEILERMAEGNMAYIARSRQGSWNPTPAMRDMVGNSGVERGLSLDMTRTPMSAPGGP